MIEPTESETKAELDRFCEAMLGIREEAFAIEEGRMDRKNNPLKNAPHTVEDLLGEWDRPYSREAACFPAGAFRVDKYWPPVNRVDNVYGDRNLVCSLGEAEAWTGQIGSAPIATAKNERANRSRSRGRSPASSLPPPRDR